MTGHGKIQQIAHFRNQIGSVFKTEIRIFNLLVDSRDQVKLFRGGKNHSQEELVLSFGHLSV